MAEGNCDETLHELYHFLDGQLTDEKRTLIARHLDDCPPCAQGYSFEIEIRRVIVSKCREEAPSALRAKIAGALGIAIPDA